MQKNLTDFVGWKTKMWQAWSSVALWLLKALMLDWEVPQQGSGRTRLCWAQWTGVNVPKGEAEAGMALPASRWTWKDLLLPWTCQICSVPPPWALETSWWDAASFWLFPSSLTRWKGGNLIILRAEVLGEQIPWFCIVCVRAVEDGASMLAVNPGTCELLGCLGPI